MKITTPIIITLLTACSTGPEYRDTLDTLDLDQGTDGRPPDTTAAAGHTTTTTTDGFEGSSTSSSSTDEQLPDASTSDGSSESTAGTSSTTAERPDLCGDGLVQWPERCDDQNADDRDYCNNDCQTYQRVFLTPPMAGWALGNPDTLCQTTADQIGLEGAFKAWIGTTTGGGLGPALTFTKDSGWYVLVGPDHPLVARGFEGLTHGVLEHAIDRDREGKWVDDKTPLAWTNATIEGEPGALDCQEWKGDGKGNAGFFRSYGMSWTSFDSYDCNTEARLICFEQRTD